jgi:hypothetical protein
VDLDLDNAPIADAARQVAQRAQLDADVTLDDDVPANARVTLRAKGVKAGTAMDLIAQAAGVNWAAEKKEGKTVLKLGKKVQSGLFSFSGPATVFRDHEALRRLVIPEGSVSVYGSALTRSTFTCPHCKGRATVLRSVQQPKCTKCERQFQPGWQFCPDDGTKRPAAASDWKFCPMCGKRVEMGMGMSDTDALAPAFGQFSLFGGDVFWHQDESAIGPIIHLLYAEEHPERKHFSIGHRF